MEQARLDQTQEEEYMEETTTLITTVKEEVRLRDWVAQIEAQQASGMTVQRWCEENGIRPKATVAKNTINIIITDSQRQAPTILSSGNQVL